MNTRFEFRCIEKTCGETRTLNEKLYECPRCKGLLDITPEYREADPALLKKLWRERLRSHAPADTSGVWRFREVLPFDPSVHPVTLSEGNTPLVDAPRCARSVGLRRLRVKHLGWNPTGSFKDYGMTVAATQAVELGSRILACASTGNTSASMAAYAARAGLKAVVFIPQGQIAYGKLSQTLDYGALTVQIEGDFDRAMQLVRGLSDTTQLYLMNSVNPFRIEGQKTILFELMDQLEWRTPDRIVVPGGNLGNISALGKALVEMRQLQLIHSIPRLTVVQAEGAAPLYQMRRTGQTELTPVSAATRATAIQIGNPVSWKKAVRSLDFAQGECLAVSEQEIAEAKALLGRDGIGCEPASATTVAGLLKLETLAPDEDVIAILTGHQLKDSEFTVDYHLGKMTLAGTARRDLENRPVQVAADQEAILELLEESLAGPA